MSKPVTQGLLVAVLVAGAAGIWASLRSDDTVAVVRRDDRWYPADAGYAGVGACIGCHGDIVERQQAGAHAKTVRRLGVNGASLRNINGHVVRDPLTGAGYQMERASDGRDRLVLRAGELEAAATLEWEFGSGHLAHGYIARLDDGGLVDSRLNWYRSIKNWDFASGQDKPTRSLLEQPLGRPLPKQEINRCFSCHSTEIRATKGALPGAAHADIEIRADRTVVGVHCEGCHGPKLPHVQSTRRGEAPPRSKPMTAVEINKMCGQCHSRSDMDPQHDVVARFQPWGLERSRCFTESAGRLSCNSCHDPHEDASRDSKYYDARCLSCHSVPAVKRRESSTVCKDRQTANCASCHMPKDEKGMRHTPFTDHRIRVVDR